MKPKMEFDTASLTVIGVDIGKEIFFTLSDLAPTGRLPSAGRSGDWV